MYFQSFVINNTSSTISGSLNGGCDNYSTAYVNGTALNNNVSSAFSVGASFPPGISAVTFLCSNGGGPAFFYVECNTGTVVNYTGLNGTGSWYWN